ncbi:MAG TPA: septum formation initiator family protein [Candidatus Paceibacterota bacterium]
MKVFLNSKLASLFLLVLVVSLSVALVRVHGNKKELQDNVEDLSSKIEDIEKDNQRLESLSAYFASDAFLEKEAREKLNYKSPDEEVAFVYLDEKEDISKDSLPERILNASNLMKWVYYLFGSRD